MLVEFVAALVALIMAVLNFGVTITVGMVLIAMVVGVVGVFILMWAVKKIVFEGVASLVGGVRSGWRRGRTE